MTRLTLDERVSESPIHTSIKFPSLALPKRRRELGILLTIFLFLSGLTFAALQSPNLAIIFLLIMITGFIIPSVLALLVLHPVRTQPQHTPATFGIEHWEDVSFFAPDHVALHGWFIPPDAQKDGATLIFVHGLGGNRGQMLHEAAVLIAKGYGALLFDLRNHGTSDSAITTFGYVEADDVQSAFEYLLTRSQVNRDRIGVVGYSMGGAAALRAAARIPQIKAVVAESTYASLEDNVATGMISQTGLPAFPFAPFMLWLGERLTGLQLKQLRPIDEVARLAPRPVLFVHGARDHTVQMANSIKLYHAAEGPSGLYLVPQVRHAGLSAAVPEEFAIRVTGFLDWAVRGIDRRARPRNN